MTMLSPSRRSGLAGPLAGLLLILIGGCAVGPDYRAPAAAVPTGWHAAVPHAGKVADLADWWGRFEDPLLAELVRTAEGDNPTLATAWFRIEQARSALTTAVASGRPQANAAAGAIRSGPIADTPSRPTTSGSVATDAVWELDLFGAVRRATEQAEAQVAARAADWHEARVSLAAEVAVTYIALRGAENLVDLYRQEAASLRTTADLVRRKAAAGFAPAADVSLAEAAAAQAEAAQRDGETTALLQRKALVALTGWNEELLTGRLAERGGILPHPADMAVTAVPVQVVSQRPDVVAAERSLAAACAAMGMAEADRYPRLSLGGTITLGRVRSDGVTGPASSWSIGPSLTMPLLDGGRRTAAVRSSAAVYEQSFQVWRQAVRTAVKEVEQALVSLDASARLQEIHERAVAGYRTTLTATTAAWQRGASSLLDLEIVRRQSIAAQHSLIAVRQARVAAWITLYKALGGGWDKPVTPHPPTTHAPSNASIGNQP